MEFHNGTAAHTNEMVVMSMFESVLVPPCTLIRTSASREPCFGQKLDRAKNRRLADARIDLVSRLKQITCGYMPIKA
jgi:hypothetical protein